MKCLIPFSVILVVGATALQGQGLDLTDYAKDSSGVTSMWDTWSMRVFGTHKQLQFSIRDKNSEARMKYTPRNPYSVGIGMTYKWISLDLGFGIKPQSIERTRRLDLNLTVAFGRNVMELTLQRYEGFDVEDADGIVYPFRSDIRSSVFGFTFVRTAPMRTLSLKALTSGMQVTKKSTGVFGYGAFWYWDRIVADSSMLPGSASELFEQRAMFDLGRQISLGAIAGYAYSLVLPKDLFVFVGGYPGIGINLGRLVADKKYVTPPFPALRINSHGAVGYAGPRIYVIFSAKAGWNGVPWGDNTRSSYTHLNFRLSVGYRFTSKIGFLENVSNFVEGI